jgi:hypothetical protein
VKIVVLLCVIAVPCRAFAADGAEQVAADFIHGTMLVGLGGTAVTSAVFVVKDFSLDGPPSMRYSAVELGVGQLTLSIGTAFLIFGTDQHDTFSQGFGAGMLAVSLPTTIHGSWGLSLDRAEERHAAGIIELAFGIPELVAGAGALAGFAADPVQDVRRTGLITTGILMVIPTAMVIHGGYLLTTDAPSRRLSLTPMLVGQTGTLGVGALAGC